jgi:hypothetical protein
MFGVLGGFDKPFNQAPSLHIALLVIIWDHWRHRLPGLLQPLWHAWCLLIGASVLTTWQHHFIDIPTGALLGIFCVWLWPLERVVSMPRAWQRTRDAQRRKLGGFYAAGAVLCLAAALYGGGIALWLAWPAASLALGGAQLHRLRRARLPDEPPWPHGWAARWLFAPYRLGAAINAWLWTRKLPASVEVVPGLRLGRRPTHAEWLAAGRPPGW